jgi:CBS domain containing-hemolysin-like protein
MDPALLLTAATAFVPPLEGSLSSALFRLLGVLLLLAANAFFVAAEFALVSIRDTRIQQLIEARRVGARTVHKLQRNLDEVLNGVQFGITLASLALGWLGEPAIASLLEPLFGRMPYAKASSHGLAIAIAFTLITYLHVILGEVVPKSLALQRAERVALAVATPMDVFLKLSKPFLRAMNAGSSVVLRIFGSRQIKEGGVHSPDELKLVVTASSRVGLLPALQEDMIHRALELANVTVREIMVPRPDIFSLPADMPLEEAIGRVVEEQHSRIPVYDPKQGPEHIIGVLYSKDISRLMHQKLTRARAGGLAVVTMQVRNLMRDVLVVPETKPLTDLLTEFKHRRRHLAVVVDEFGSTSGVVTVEDVLEQVVGEIEDEFDVAESAPIRLGSGTMLLDGAENLLDLETQHNVSLPRDEGFETLAGFVISRLQRIPRQGDSFEYENHRFTVTAMEGNRVAQVKLEEIDRRKSQRVEASNF